MCVGVHLSIAGGIHKAFERAEKLGCETFQIFIKNPRGWKAKELKEEEIELVKKIKKQTKISPVVVHMTYLVNLASPNDELYKKSLQGLKEEYIRAGKMGFEYLVIHPGNHTGAGLEAGVERIQAALNEILALDFSTKILLENVSGGGTRIGKNFLELKMIRDGVHKTDKIGLCFDTCHGYAAGYDLGKEEGWQRVLDGLNKYFSFDDLKLLHINDSVGECGSFLDRHEHLGKGKIGDKGFSIMAGYSLFRKLPMILETPKKSDRDDLVNMKKLRAYLGRDTVERH